jgi:hypothetical protein
MKKWFIEAILMSFLVALPSLVFAQSAKETVRALKKLETKVQAGTSLRDYLSALGDALFEVNLFLESPEAKARAALSTSIKKAMDHYKTAGDIWRYKLEAISVYGIKGEFIFYEDQDKELGESLLRKYPSLMKTKEFLFEKNALHIDKVIDIIWTEAVTESKRAASLFSQGSK